MLGIQGPMATNSKSNIATVWETSGTGASMSARHGYGGTIGSLSQSSDMHGGLAKLHGTIRNFLASWPMGKETRSRRWAVRELYLVQKGKWCDPGEKGGPIYPSTRATDIAHAMLQRLRDGSAVETLPSGRLSPIFWLACRRMRDDDPRAWEADPRWGNKCFESGVTVGGEARGCIVMNSSNCAATLTGTIHAAAAEALALQSEFPSHASGAAFGRFASERAAGGPACLLSVRTAGSKGNSADSPVGNWGEGQTTGREIHQEVFPPLFSVQFPKTAFSRAAG